MGISGTRAALAAGALLAAVSLASGAQAGVDTFNTEPVGVPVGPGGLTNWTVSGVGIDVVDNNTYSIFCLGNVGRCVDLDGTPGPGQINSRAAVSFDANELVTLAFYASGNQRTEGGGAENLYAGFTFDGLHTINRFAGGGFGALASGPVAKSGFQLATTVSGDAFHLYTLSFTSTTAGSAHAFIGTTSADNIGPVIDDVSFAVPEPATWAMMLMGFGGMGAMLRRRRAALA